MAMIKCPECGHEISDKADKCPNCGNPIKKSKSVAVLGIVIICAIIIAFVLISSLGDLSKAF